MTELTERLRRRYFPDSLHPYHIFDATVAEALPRGGTLIDAGCGRTAPNLVTYRGRAGRLIGADLVDFTVSDPDLELHRADITAIPVANETADVIMARSVMEHVERPLETYTEAMRVLKPGGHFIFLTASAWDYASVIAMMVPNRWHPRIVKKVEGRAEEDVFPTRYRTNTHRAVRRFASQTDFDIKQLKYLGQYPSYFTFNGALFLVATAYEKLIERFDSLAFLRGWILADLVKR